MSLKMVSPIDCGEGSERKRAHKQALGFQNYLGMRALRERERETDAETELVTEIDQQRRN